MSDDKSDNVIDFFKKSAKISGGQKFFKGFPYIKITKDDNGNLFKEEFLTEYAKRCFYIVSVVRSMGLGSAIYKYKVPYASLIDFLNEFKNNESYGKIIDIERYIPEDLA